jgi:hypothetical protein
VKIVKIPEQRVRFASGDRAFLAALLQQLPTQALRRMRLLAHLPSVDFQANAAWLTLAGITHNLMRALGTLASAFHAGATTATIRGQLIDGPARIARGARRLTVPPEDPTPGRPFDLPGE